MKITRDDTRITMMSERGATWTAQSIEANLMFEMLEKLEEIRCGLIDVETAMRESKK